MQLNIYHQLDKPLILPINYNSVLQGIIYNSLRSNPSYSSFIHDEGYAYSNRVFKLFTFSNIKGKYRIKDKKIVFYDTVSFSVRSINSLMIVLLKEKLSNGINYNGNLYSNIYCELEDTTVEDEEIYIDMMTPICLYTTNENKTIYFTPVDEEFYCLLNDNFYRKYYAYNGVYPTSPLYLEPLSVGPKDKVVTKYKTTYITGYKGKYILRGERKYLDFIYQVGIGSKNAQGFGMFEIME